MLAVLLLPLPLGALEEAAGQGQRSVVGGFEMAGFISTGAGWQRFTRAATTERAYDGSYAGAVGSVISDIYAVASPSAGQDNFLFFVETAELDLMKDIGSRAKLRADLLFGRAASGSWTGIDGVDVEQAFLSVLFGEGEAWELSIGRFGSPMGFEPFEPHSQDTISWSILGRSWLYAPISTGISLSGDLSGSWWFLVALSNGLANDDIAHVNDVPCAYATLRYSWGEGERESSISLSPLFGPDSDSNRRFTMGANATAILRPTGRLALGLEADFRRDNANPDYAGAENTDYYGGLINLRYDFTERFYGVLKTAFLRQDAAGNGWNNLTGQEQDIYEFSLGGGFAVAEQVMFKAEARLDLIDPAGAKDQWVPGVAVSMVNAF